MLPNNYNDYSIITSNFNSNYYDLLGQKENLGFNLQTLSRLSWSDIGDYFSTLINEIGLGLNVSNISSRSGGGPMFSEPNLTNQYVYDMMLRIPGERPKEGTIKERITKKYGFDVSYADDDNLRRLDKNITSSRINIVTDNSFNEIADRYNADAITLGPNIIFAKDKFNSQTPQGMALLVHELTHIYQLKKLHDSPYGNYHNPANSLKNKWEQEALNNEQFAYELLTDSNKLYENALSYGKIHAMYDQNMVSSFVLPYHIANNYDINGDYNDNRVNNARKTSVDLTTILEIVSKKNSSFEQVGSSLGDIESYRYPTLLPSFFTIPRLDLLPSNKSPYLNTTSSDSLAYNNYPDLSFGNMLNPTKNDIVSRTTTNNSANSKYYVNNSSSNSISYPITPLFAEHSRNIDMNSALGSDSSQHTSVSLPPAMDNPLSSNTVNLDIEAIAEKVYQILYNKIKIQRARRGIR